MLGEKVYRITDGLSKFLQLPHLSALDARSQAKDVIRVLESLCSDDDFTKFKEKVDNRGQEMGELLSH